MIDDVSRMMYDVFSACAYWFSSVFYSTGTTGFFLGILFIVMSVRYLLGPLFGAGSDRAKKKGTDGDE